MTKAEQILDKHSKTIPLHPNAALAAMKEIADLAFQAGRELESLSNGDFETFQKEAIDKETFINNLFNQQL